MAKESSFDIGFNPPISEIENAHDQALKELSQRYDFRGTNTTIELDRKEMSFTLQTLDPMKMANLRDILERRLVGRGIPPAALHPGEIQPAAGGTVRLTISLQKGLPEDKIKTIAAAVKESGIKARTQIQGAEIRVSAKSRDELQAVIAFLKKADFGCALEFGNYR